MELYLRWLAKYEQQPHELSPIGLILCSDKNDELVELLELDSAGIHLAQYLLELPRDWRFEEIEKASREGAF